MNKQFAKYLAMLENAAPASRKGDIRAARNLYARHGDAILTEGLFSDPFSSASSKPKTFGGTHVGMTKAGRTEEQKNQDALEAQRINDALAGFDMAAETIDTVASHDPGRVDAWVDFRLKPAIERAIANGTKFLTPEESKKAAKERYDECKSKFEKDDRVAKENEAASRADALATADRVAADKAHEADEARSAEKRAALGKDREYKWNASMPLNASDRDVNTDIATKRSEDLEKAERADSAYRAFEKKASDNGLYADVDTPIRSVDTEKAKEADEAFDKAQQFWNNDDMWAFESVSTKKLRAVFESVYGPSAGYSDGEIRTICESCYRRVFLESEGPKADEAIIAYGNGRVLKIEREGGFITSDNKESIPSTCSYTIVNVSGSKSLASCIGKKIQFPEGCKEGAELKAAINLDGSWKNWKSGSPVTKIISRIG